MDSTYFANNGYHILYFECKLVVDVTDFNVARTSMGYGGGGFWQWFRRNNNTYPFVMPRPGCRGEHSNLWDCDAWTNTHRIPLAENLCQGRCGNNLLGPPTFEGWKQHWKGLEFLNVPFEYVNGDPEKVSVMKQSLSRLEYVDIEYAGYDK